MDQQLEDARSHFIQGLSRISHFWGFPKAMGTIFGALYLSPMPMSLDELVEQARVSKGSVSTNVRTLERLGMVHKHIIIGDRKDYYSAETDFWKIIKSILKEREVSEFDQALKTVDESMDMITTPKNTIEDSETAHFYQERMMAMQKFFKTLDNLVAMLLTFDELRLGSVDRLIQKNSNR